MRKGRPKGYTLVELMAVIAVTSSLMAITSVTLAMLLRGSRHGADLVAQQTTIGRLAAQVRRDVHAADKLQLQSEQQLAIELPGAVRIEYSAAAGLVERAEFEAARRVRQEEYLLPESSRIRVFLDRQGEFDIAGFTLGVSSSSSSSSDGAESGRELKVAAVVGRDHQLSALEFREAAP